MNSYKSVLCVAPFSSLVIMQSGQLFPCCAWTDSPKLVSKLDENKTIDSNFNTTNAALRSIFLKTGNVPIKNCTNCISLSKQNELHNLEANPNIDYLTTSTLTNLHLKVSNLCNLACRMCDPYSSSLLAKEHNKFIEVKDNKKKYEQSSLEIGTPVFQSILDTIENLNFVWFSGGEPLINPVVWAFLEHGYKTGHSKNIKLQFNTNGTFKLKEHHLKILKSYKHVTMHLSMDGTEKHAEYIRTNVVWDEWVEDLKVYYDNFATSAGNINSSLEINITISVFNVHILDKVETFFDNFDPRGRMNIIYNFVFYPEELNIRNLNKECKEYLITKYQNSEIVLQWPKLSQAIKQRPSMDSSVVAEYIDNMDQNAISKNLYKKYHLFRDVDPEWFSMIKRSDNL